MGLAGAGKKKDQRKGQEGTGVFRLPRKKKGKEREKKKRHQGVRGGGRRAAAL